MADFEVKQDSYPASPDAAQVAVRASRRNEAISPDYFQQWVAEGRVFIASQAAIETARDIGALIYASTEPAIAVDVPTGTTMIPLEIEIQQGGTVANATVAYHTALFTLDDKVRITSGTAVTPRNLRISATEPRTSKCTIKIHDESGTDLLCAANAEDNTFYGGLVHSDLDGLGGAQCRWSCKKFIPGVLKGPAALCCYLYGGTSARPEAFWHLIWAEFDTDELWTP